MKDKKKQVETKMTVASRIVKLESQITYLERKLDHLINVYRKDQMRYKRTDTTNSGHEEEEVTASASANQQAATSSANQYLGPFYKREESNKTSSLSMNLLSPEPTVIKNPTKVKNRSASQPTSMENLRSLSETKASQNTDSPPDKPMFASRTTSIKIPSFFDGKRNSKS